jgi:hypothetical protein
MRNQWKKKTNRRQKKKNQKPKTNKQTNTSEPTTGHAEQTNLGMQERRRACCSKREKTEPETQRERKD